MGRYTGKKCRLLTMFGLTATFFLVELIVGYITNSMALVADSFHMLSDVLALVIAFLSVKMSPKKWSKNTFGWARAEVLGALVNSVFLLALCFSIFVESLKRLYETEELHNPQMILIVGVIGLIINLIGLGLFHEHGHGHSHGGHGHSHDSPENKLSTINALVATDDNENDERFTPPTSLSSQDRPGEEGNKSASQMNMRGVFLHVLSDAMGSVVVIISALVVWLTEWEYSKYIDPALSLCLVTLITASTWPLLKVSALILLQTVPTHIQVDGIQKQLLNVDGVLAVHEFHVWQLAGERIIASAHIRCRNLKDYMVLAEKIKKMFHEEGIHSTTIQPEFVEFEDDGASASIDSAEDCILDCPSKDKDGCVANTCCGLAKQVKSVSKEEFEFSSIKPNEVTSPALTELSLQLKMSCSLPNVSQASCSACSTHWSSPDVTANAFLENANAFSQNLQNITCTQISPASEVESYVEVSPVAGDSTSRDTVDFSCTCLGVNDDQIIHSCHAQNKSQHINGFQKNLENILNINGIGHGSSYMASIAVVVDTETEEIPT